MQLNRQQLYALSWAIPQLTLAELAGRSATRLSQITQELRIPRPSPGYWHQVRAGRRLPREPLPFPDDRRLTTVIVDDSLADYMQQLLMALGDPAVPADDPLPMLPADLAVTPAPVASLPRGGADARLLIATTVVESPDQSAGAERRASIDPSRCPSSLPPSANAAGPSLTQSGQERAPGEAASPCCASGPTALEGDGAPASPSADDPPERSTAPRWLPSAGLANAFDGERLCGVSGQGGAVDLTQVLSTYSAAFEQWEVCRRLLDELALRAQRMPSPASECWAVWVAQARWALTQRDPVAALITALGHAGPDEALHIGGPQG